MKSYIILFLIYLSPLVAGSLTWYNMPGSGAPTAYVTIEFTVNAHYADSTEGLIHIYKNGVYVGGDGDPASYSMTTSTSGYINFSAAGREWDPDYEVYSSTEEWIYSGVQVYPPPCNPTITPSSTSGRAPFVVTLNGSSSTAPWGSTPVNILWNLGESFASSVWPYVTPPNLNQTITYNNNGSAPFVHQVNLKMWVSYGPQSTSPSHSITVYPSGSKSVTVQNGTTSMPYQMPAATVTLAASMPVGTTFSGWSIVSGNGSFANANASPTTFTVGSSDTVIKAGFVLPVPQSVAASSAFNNVSLSWAYAQSSIQLAAFDIYRTKDGATVLAGSATPSSFTFQDWNVTPSTSYTYYVKARHVTGDTSNASQSVNISTPAVPDSDGDGVPDPIETLLNIATNPNPTSGSNLNLIIHRPVQ
jgi:hypothetical protein